METYEKVKFTIIDNCVLISIKYYVYDFKTSYYYNYDVTKSFV